jgi:PilC-like protein with beta-propeller domain
MSRHLRPTAAVSTLILVLLLLLAAGGRPALSDDTDLLRFNSGKPYVFFLLDTSASMTLTADGKWVHANGDDPRSKLYQAKQILYQVFQEVDDIHFGFASMNQDNAAAAAKHWLYYFTGSLPANWPISYPLANPGGPQLFNTDGTAREDVGVDLMTFGPHLTGVAGATCVGTKCTAGTCAAPLSLSTQREQINRYAKLGVGGDETTEIWLSTTGNRTFRLTVDKPDNSAKAALGQSVMNAKFVLEQFSSCAGSPTATFTTHLDLNLWTDFLMFDENVGSATAPNGTHNGGVDKVAGFWDAKDILNTSTCGSGHPFSGEGWEGNYDGEANLPVPQGVSLNSTFDPHCANPAVPATCYNLKRTTSFNTEFGRPLDRGDILPLDWDSENKDAFLDRLAPNQSDSPADFRIASYFKDDPDATTGVLPLATAGRSPLFGTGPTPLAKMVADFRCFYQGEGNKCKDEAYDPGWESIAKANDSEWGCRRPYLIVISDGGDSCGGENPCADTANLNSKSSVKTWVIAYGAGNNCGQPPLSCMAQNGKGELLCPQNAKDLKDELLKILGLIREETRAFASAAVPSIQTNVDQTVYLTDFTPINGKSVWDGHIDAYLKPVPPVNPPIDLRPDRTETCRSDSTESCHLWDAGEVMRVLQANADPLGDEADQRRVYYAVENTTGLYAEARRLLEKPRDRGTTDDPDETLWEDLLKAFEIPFTDGDQTSEDAARARADLVLQKTFAVKTATVTTTDPATGKPTTKTLQYLLGDIFHSNPLVVGSPPNTKYFTDDLHGYRDFFRRHELRRKMLVVGSNDGLLHVFDAGIYRGGSSTTPSAPPPVTAPNTPPNEFDNGSGRELFAFAPRSVLPTMRQLAESTVHQWGVDGTVTVADVFVDPELARHGGLPDPAKRKWRTVIFGGLREGGAGYYALDITQPDTLDADNVPQPKGGSSGPPFLPSCTDLDLTNCGPLAFPAALWEFDDSVRDASGVPVKLDEDGNDVSDLGAAWSIPNVGRIRLTEGGETVEKYVMVVGGGFDPDNKATPTRGYWLYMIDIETGKVLYKRQLTGAVPSEPSAVDTDLDGFFDRIYIGTTAGKMYRVDLTADSSGAFPALTSKTVRGLDANTYIVERVPDANWQPRLLFDANTGLSAGQTRPIFYRPSVIFVPSLGRFALLFGTGDRENLWKSTDIAGRFYVFVDDSEDLPAGTVLDETRFNRITVSSPAATQEFLFSGAVGSRGWYLVLDPDERLITDPFALSGVAFFSTYQPDVIVSGGRDPLCSKTGTSRIFVVSTVNGNPFLRDANNVAVRNATVNDFVTNPFTEDRLLKSASSGTGPGGGGGEICDTETMNALRNALKTIFPANCRFTNQTVDIKTVSSKTALICIAPIPVCTVEKNWREQ